jgi:DNA polymerase I
LEQPPAPPRSPLIFDIETDGLLDKLSRIHCISIHDPETGVTDGYPPHLVPEALRRLAGTERRLCGHNIIAFDIPAIQKLYPWFKPQALPLDTKVWSQLVTPDIWDLTQKKPAWRRQCPPQLADSHSLKAWGYRLGVLKGESPDTTWQTYSPEMLEYNKQDTIVTFHLWNELFKWTTSDSAVDLEMQVACILVRQEQHGVCFDVKAAEKLAVQLADELQALKDQLQQYFPPWQRLVKRAISKVNNQKLGRVKGQEYEVWETVEFNPNSNPHIVKCLKDKYEWEPTVFTDKGNPQLDDEILADLDNLGSMPEVSLIRKYKTASKILGYVSAGANSWLNHVKNGRIHGNVQGCGAGTRRMTHNSPNLGQVPSVRAYLGKECRALFSPPPGYLMVGIDADQLELRTLSHFLFPYDGGEYAHAAIHGSKENKDDIHWRNAKAIGVDRDSGKTVFYAYVYGAGLEKLGRTVTKSWDKDTNVKAGARIKRNLERGLPALVKLKERLIETARSRGFLYDLDGQMFRLRSEHSALNELNQRAGAILMKRWQVLLYAKLDAASIDWHPLLTVHDEIQVAVRPQDVSLVKQLSTETFAEVTTLYKLKCPITGEGGSGANWSETH